MKKWWIILPLALMLAGCSDTAEPVYETVGQIEYEPVVQAQPQHINVWTPADAAVETLAGEQDAVLYVWSDCELRVETLEAGDIQRTMETLTGIGYDGLTVMNYEKDGVEYYETVWTSGGEDGLYLGRALVADDGDFHYCLSLLSPEEADTGEVYAQICSSFALTSEDAEK